MLVELDAPFRIPGVAAVEHHGSTHAETAVHLRLVGEAGDVRIAHQRHVALVQEIGHAAHELTYSCSP
ncbi:hypothetical protein CTI14_07050 [Methylobacterium radiotolerans]|nr:hypothetical protein CTI14_07050 [Methylobacterium radiotolerans]